jgi:hypothetical protein
MDRKKMSTMDELSDGKIHGYIDEWKDGGTNE